MYARVHESMMRRLVPTMHASIKAGCVHTGAYPSANPSYIGILVARDQDIFDEFMLYCRVSTSAAKTLVTREEHLLTYDAVQSNLSTFGYDGYFPHFKDMGASVLPAHLQGHMQLSAQFPSGITLPNSNTVLTMRAQCKGYAPREIFVRGNAVYSAFHDQCAQRKRAMRTLRSFVDHAHNPEVVCKFNPLAGHKIELGEDAVQGSTCAQLLLYVVRRKAPPSPAKRGKARDEGGKYSLCVLAVDAILDMREELTHAAATHECAICMEPIENMSASWRCKTCGNHVHHPCMETWKTRGTTCPFCRCHLDG